MVEKSVCRIRDLAERFGVSHVTVHRIIDRLIGQGLVVTQPYQPLQLTSKGKRLAIQSRKRHEVVYDFLVAIGVGPNAAALDAEGIEHHVSPETLRMMKRLLGRSN